MSKGIALHIGLNGVDAGQYEGWAGPLVACEADAADMQGIAKSRGFDSRLLLTKDATRDAVRGAIRDAAGALVSGDMFFLSYSGHGGQVPDQNGDEDDGLDETWCLYDGELIDDELYALWGSFAPDVRILTLSDSCHSGTAVRQAFMATLVATGALHALVAPTGDRPAQRAMPPDVANRVYRAHRDFYDGLQKGLAGEKAAAQISSSVLLLSGCQDNQTSSDGAFNGLFTGNLLRVWRQGDFAGDYREFHKAIVARMPPVQTPNYYRVGAPDPAFDAQQPFMV